MPDHPVILFDGVCNLCNSAVQYIIRNDPHALFKFASLQGETGQHLLKQYKLPAKEINSIVLIQNNTPYTKSEAALKIAKLLKGPAKLWYGFIIVPVFIRDAVYRFIARNRYKWFGKKDECMLPAPELTGRFLK